MSHEAVNWAYEQEFRSGADMAVRKFILVSIADHADEHGICWPSIGRLARRVGVARSTAQRHLDELEYQHRVIHREPRPGSSSIIVLHLPRTHGRIWGVTDAPPLPIEGVTDHRSPSPVPTPVDNPSGGDRSSVTYLTDHRSGGDRPGESGGNRPGESRTVMNRHEPSREPERIPHTVTDGRVAYVLDDATRATGLDNVRTIRAQLNERKST